MDKSLARLLYLKSSHFSSLVKGRFNQRVLGWPRETQQALRKDRVPVSYLVARNRNTSLKRHKPQEKGLAHMTGKLRGGMSSGLIDPGAQGHHQGPTFLLFLPSSL